MGTYVQYESSQYLIPWYLCAMKFMRYDIYANDIYANWDWWKVFNSDIWTKVGKVLTKWTFISTKYAFKTEIQTQRVYHDSKIREIYLLKEIFQEGIFSTMIFMRMIFMRIYKFA